MEMLTMDRLIEVTRYSERISFPVEILNAKTTASDYLSVVFCKRLDKEEFVTWSFNHSCGGFYLGHYFANKAEAVKDFIVR